MSICENEELKKILNRLAISLEDLQKEMDKICKITTDEYIKKCGEEFQEKYELVKELEELKHGK